MSDGPEWFASKRYGYGTGAPISWQGWALTLGFVLMIIALGIAFKDRPAALFASIVPPTVAFMVICAKTTRGGWRWGGED